MKPKLIGKVWIYVESGSGGGYQKLPQDDPRYITGFISADMNRRATGAPRNKKNYTSTGVLFSQVSSSNEKHNYHRIIVQLLGTKNERIHRNKDY
jgi:hypothetical protein